MKIAVLVSGASGALLAKRFIEVTYKKHELFIVFSKRAEWIFEKETGDRVDDFLDNKNCFKYESNDFTSPLASGSFKIDAGVVIPCSAKTLSSIANGYADNLISRCADVCLKERRRLIIVFRETPLNLIHIENMRKVTYAGAIVMPPVLSFYSNPKGVDDIVDFVVGKVLDNLGIENTLYTRWENLEDRQ